MIPSPTVPAEQLRVAAKCCCACIHWHRHGKMDGQCRNPKMRHGVTYKDKNTGEETHIEWWTTGCYHSCPNWSDVSTPNTDLSESARDKSPLTSKLLRPAPIRRAK